MEKAAKELNFIEAARLRDIMMKYKKAGRRPACVILTI